MKFKATLSGNVIMTQNDSLTNYRFIVTKGKYKLYCGKVLIQEFETYSELEQYVEINCT